MPVVLQVNFGWDLSEEELGQFSTAEKAKVFWAVPGLLWKIWVRNPETRLSGGIYLFKDRASAQAYCDGPIAAQIKKFPKSSNHSFNIFEIREDQTAVTGGPLNAEMVRGELPQEIRALIDNVAA
ncbi:YdhR family protein [Hyphomonas polymorpha]|nr:YdhR family protein [Hyphomonas polymorpha]